MQLAMAPSEDDLAAGALAIARHFTQLSMFSVSYRYAHESNDSMTNSCAWPARVAVALRLRALIEVFFIKPRKGQLSVLDWCPSWFEEIRNSELEKLAGRVYGSLSESDAHLTWKSVKNESGPGEPIPGFDTIAAGLAVLGEALTKFWGELGEGRYPAFEEELGKGMRLAQKARNHFEAKSSGLR